MDLFIFVLAAITVAVILSSIATDEGLTGIFVGFSIIWIVNPDKITSSEDESGIVWQPGEIGQNDL